MRIILIAALALMVTSPAIAMPLPKPSGPVILTVTGAIDNADAGGKAEFDMEMLNALQQRQTTTLTPWYDGETTFRGPLGSALLEAVGARGTMLHVVAVNDYTAEVPVADLINDPVIFATHINGQPMAIRDKGPVFLIYPFGENPDLYNEAYFGKSVWQIVSIDVH